MAEVKGAMVAGGDEDTPPRFPRLIDCAHFHYEHVDLESFSLCLTEEELKPLTVCDDDNTWFCVRIAAKESSWVVRRSMKQFIQLDQQLHQCIYDRKFSLLKPLMQEDSIKVRDYLNRLSSISGPLMNCGPVLNWMEMDNRGRHLLVVDDSAINTPAVAAALVIKGYDAQACDELSLKVRDMVSIIDMPPPAESVWWRGKHNYLVGFFPSECVELISDPAVQVLDSSPTRPLHRKHGKLMAFFRNFLLTRPSRRKLKQSGIYKERVFGCDLGEHLLNSGHEIPEVLRCCSDFIEEHGILDGIYRLSGINSNIQKLREAFDAAKIPDMVDPVIMKDIHSVSSLLKLYFRELPNPLLTHQLYPQFVQAIQYPDSARLQGIQQVVHQLPPPHYRTLVFLCQHLSRIAKHAHRTSMSARNLAIVWAPNLLWSPDINKEGAGITALRDVGVQAVVTEFLITYCDLVFCDRPPSTEESRLSSPDQCKKTRPKSLAISTPTKLLSLEEARSRAFGLTRNEDAYIDVGGGPSSLPPRYHTVLEGPSRARERSRGSLKLRSSWRNLFWRSRSRGKGSRESPGKILIQHMTPASRLQQGCAKTEVDVFNPSGSKRLRPVKSAESLVSSARSSLVGSPNIIEGDDKENANPEQQVQQLYMQENEVHSRAHARTISHESYFNTLKVTFNDSMDTDVDSVLEMKPIKDVGSPMSVDKYLFTFTNSMEEDRSPESILKEWGILLDFGNKERNLQYSCSLQQLQTQDDAFNLKRKVASVPTLHYDNPVLKEVPKLDSPCEEMEDALHPKGDEDDSTEVMTVSEGISSLIHNVGEMETSRSTPTTTGSSSILSPHPVSVKVIKADVHTSPKYENLLFHGEETPSTDEDVGVYENLDIDSSKAKIQNSALVEETTPTTSSSNLEGYSPFSDASPIMRRSYSFSSGSWRCSSGEDLRRRFDSEIGRELVHEQRMKREIEEAHSPKLRNSTCDELQYSATHDVTNLSKQEMLLSPTKDRSPRHSARISASLCVTESMPEVAESTSEDAMVSPSLCMTESMPKVAEPTSEDAIVSASLCMTECMLEVDEPTSEDAMVSPSLCMAESMPEASEPTSEDAIVPASLCMTESMPEVDEPTSKDAIVSASLCMTESMPEAAELTSEDATVSVGLCMTEVMPEVAEPTFEDAIVSVSLCMTESIPQDGEPTSEDATVSASLSMTEVAEPTSEDAMVSASLCMTKSMPQVGDPEDAIVSSSLCMTESMPELTSDDASLCMTSLVSPMTPPAGDIPIPILQETAKDKENCKFQGEKIHEKQVDELEKNSLSEDKEGTDDECGKRERIEKYKQERRNYLREKYRSESFRGEKDEVIQRLKQKVARLSSGQTEIEAESVVSGIAQKRKIHPVETCSEPRFPDNKGSKPKVSCRKVTPPRSLPVEETTRTKLITRRMDVPKIERTTRGNLPRLTSVEICKSPTKTSTFSTRELPRRSTSKIETLSPESGSKSRSVSVPGLPVESPVERQASPLEEVNVKERLNLWKRNDERVPKTKYETPKVKVGAQKKTTSPAHDIIIKRELPIPKCLSASKTCSPQVKDKVAMFEMGKRPS